MAIQGPTNGQRHLVPLRPGALRAIDLERRAAKDGYIALGPGHYFLDRTATFSRSITIAGAGIEATIIHWFGSGAALAFTNDLGIAFGEVRDLQILGASSGNTGEIGIRVGRDVSSPVSGQMSFHNVRCKYLELGWDLKASVIGRFFHCSGILCDRGLANGTVNSSIQNSFWHCQFEQNGVGMHWTRGQIAAFYSCIWQNNKGPAIILGNAADGDNAQHMLFVQPYFENNWLDHARAPADRAAIQVASTAPTQKVRNVVMMAVHSKEPHAHMVSAAASEEVAFMGPITGGNFTAHWDGVVFQHSPTRAAIAWHNSLGDQGYAKVVHRPPDNRTWPAGSRGDTLHIEYTNPSTTITQFGTQRLWEGARLRVKIAAANITVQHGVASKQPLLYDNTDWTPPYPAVIDFELDASNRWQEVNRAWLGGCDHPVAEPLYP